MGWMTKPKYATAAERSIAVSAQAREQMLRQWAAKQDAPGYSGRHRRVRKARGPAKGYQCEVCGSRVAKDWAQTHGTDGCDPMDYRPMCQQCHSAYDDIGAKAKAALSHEQLADMARARWARWDPETRFAIVAKGHATRKANLVARDSPILRTD